MGVAPEFELGEQLVVKKDATIFNADMTPSIILYNPKYPHNVGGTVRAASNFGAKVVMFTGNRVSLEPNGKKGGYRLPREERMRDYEDIVLINDDYPLNRFNGKITPIAVELRKNAESLPYFDHPDNPLYIFGPEDGNIPQVILRHCYRFLVIPSVHCLNLAAAVNVVLYDRISKVIKMKGGTI